MNQPHELASIDVVLVPEHENEPDENGDVYMIVPDDNGEASGLTVKFPASMVQGDFGGPYPSIEATFTIPNDRQPV